MRGISSWETYSVTEAAFRTGRVGVKLSHRREGTPFQQDQYRRSPQDIIYRYTK